MLGWALRRWNYGIAVWSDKVLHGCLLLTEQVDLALGHHVMLFTYDLFSIIIWSWLLAQSSIDESRLSHGHIVINCIATDSPTDVEPHNFKCELITQTAVIFRWNWLLMNQVGTGWDRLSISTSWIFDKSAIKHEGLCPVWIGRAYTWEASRDVFSVLLTIVIGSSVGHFS